MHLFVGRTCVTPWSCSQELKETWPGDEVASYPGHGHTIGTRLVITISKGTLVHYMQNTTGCKCIIIHTLYLALVNSNIVVECYTKKCPCFNPTWILVWWFMALANVCLQHMRIDFPNL
jgi:hypothetical protein